MEDFQIEKELAQEFETKISYLEGKATKLYDEHRGAKRLLEIKSAAERKIHDIERQKKDGQDLMSVPQIASKMNAVASNIKEAWESIVELSRIACPGGETPDYIVPEGIMFYTWNDNFHVGNRPTDACDHVSVHVPIKEKTMEGNSIYFNGFKSNMDSLNASNKPGKDNPFLDLLWEWRGNNYYKPLPTDIKTSIELSYKAPWASYKTKNPSGIGKERVGTNAWKERNSSSVKMDGFHVIKPIIREKFGMEQRVYSIPDVDIGACMIDLLKPGEWNNYRGGLLCFDDEFIDATVSVAEIVKKATNDLKKSLQKGSYTPSPAVFGEFKGDVKMDPDNPDHVKNLKEYLYRQEKMLDEYEQEWKDDLKIQSLKKDVILTLQEKVLKEKEKIEDEFRVSTKEIEEMK